MTTCDKPYGYCELLEELKEQGLSEEEGIRELDGKHWTEWHPNRRRWTPHQRALAGMMTQEAYEGLYGFGRPADYVCPCENTAIAVDEDPGQVPAYLCESLESIDNRLDRLATELGLRTVNKPKPIDEELAEDTPEFAHLEEIGAPVKQFVGVSAQSFRNYCYTWGWLKKPKSNQPFAVVEESLDSITSKIDRLMAHLGA